MNFGPVASDASGYPLCQKRLVGALPNPLPVAEVPSAAARSRTPAFFIKQLKKQFKMDICREALAAGSLRPWNDTIPTMYRCLMDRRYLFSSIAKSVS